jgi:hypothetical protein
MGRTKLRWLEDVENDLQELKVKRRIKRQREGRLVTNRKGGQGSLGTSQGVSEVKSRVTSAGWDQLKVGFQQ